MITVLAGMEIGLGIVALICGEILLGIGMIVLGFILLLMEV